MRVRQAARNYFFMCSACSHPLPTAPPSGTRLSNSKVSTLPFPATLRQYLETLLYRPPSHRTGLCHGRFLLCCPPQATHSLTPCPFTPQRITCSLSGLLSVLSPPTSHPTRAEFYFRAIHFASVWLQLLPRCLCNRAATCTPHVHIRYISPAFHILLLPRCLHITQHKHSFLVSFSAAPLVQRSAR